MTKCVYVGFRCHLGQWQNVEIKLIITHHRRRVECGADKGGVFDTVLLDRAAETGSVGGLSVYVGDSASDLAALTAADVGIVIGRNALLRRICDAAGLRVLPLTAGEHKAVRPSRLAGTLACAS